jgi:hypothetical protein
MLTFAVCEAESEAPPTAREIDTLFFARVQCVGVCARAVEYSPVYTEYIKNKYGGTADAGQEGSGRA